MLIYKISLGQLTTIFTIILTIVSAFSLTTIIILIQKIKTGSIRDYDDYMCLRFEKRDDTELTVERRVKIMPTPTNIRIINEDEAEHF